MNEISDENMAIFDERLLSHSIKSIFPVKKSPAFV